MNRLLVCVIALSSLFISQQSEAQLSVEILDAPRSVYSFEPVYVTYEVRNEGSYPVVVPGDPFASQGVSLKVGRRDEPLKDHLLLTDIPPSRLVWLPPGGRWLFFERVWFGPEGVFEIQAVLRSPGECTGKPVGPEKHRIEPARPIERGVRPYDCWSGEARSQKIEVVVETPTAEVDLAAAEFLGVTPESTNWGGLKVGFAALYKRFPESHYTYAAFGIVQGGASMLNLVALQPDNALNPWVTAAISQSLAYHNRRCPTLGLPSVHGSAEVEERRARVIAAYPPPEPVKAYLRQLELELAAEECPRGETGASDSPLNERDRDGEASDG